MNILFFDYENSRLDDVVSVCEKISQYVDDVIVIPDSMSVVKNCDIEFLKMYRDFIDSRIKEMEKINEEPWIPFVKTRYKE